MSETDGTRQEQRRVDREAVFNLYLHKWLPVCEAKKNCQLGKQKYHMPGNSLRPFLGWLSDPFKWLSDLQLGDERVTLNHLVIVFFHCRCSFPNYIMGEKSSCHFEGLFQGQFLGVWATARIIQLKRLDTL